MDYSKIKPIIHSLVTYEAASKTHCKRNFSHQAKEATKKLAEEITTDILGLIKPARNEEIYQLRVGNYSSNLDVQLQVGKTLFLNAQRLRELPKAEIKNNVFNTLDRIFKLPTIEGYETKNNGFESLDSSQLDSSLIQLTRTILAEPLIEAYLNPDPDEVDEELDDEDEDEFSINSSDDDSSEAGLEEFEISDQKTKIIANLGEIGLITLQKQLKDCTEEVYATGHKVDLKESRIKLDNLLRSIRLYNPSSIDEKLINKKLLLEIFMNELKKGSNGEVLREKRNESVYILEWTADILRQFNLDLNSTFINDFENNLGTFKGKSRLKALGAISKTKITDNSSSAKFIAEQMVKVLTSKQTKGEDKFFASQFLINNPHLISGILIQKLIQAITLSENETEVCKSDSAFCSILILNSLAKEERLRTPIKKLLILNLQKIIHKQNLNENFVSLAHHLLVLSPLLKSPKILIDLYTKYHKNIDKENLVYLAASISRFREQVDEIQTEPLKSTLLEVSKIVNNNKDTIEAWEGPGLSRIRTLANSNIYDLIQESINEQTPSFGMLNEVMQNNKAREIIIEYLNKSKSNKVALNILTNTLLTRLIDLDEYQNRSYITTGEAPILITKLKNSSKDDEQETTLTINDLLQFHGSNYYELHEASLLEDLEKELTLGFMNMGKAAEQPLLNVVIKANEHRDDIMKKRQSELAESILRARSYLPESSFAQSS